MPHMTAQDWIQSFPGTVLVCDTDGILIEMNEAAVRMLEKDGGRTLLGANILDCHPPAAREKLHLLMKNRTSNLYTVEKNGTKRMIHQFPWYRGGDYAGFIEISFALPPALPNFRRE